MWVFLFRRVFLVCMALMPDASASAQTQRSAPAPVLQTSRPANLSGKTLPRGAVARLLGGSNPFLSMAFSPDGKWLASGGYEKLLQIWDPQSGKEVRRWSTPEGNIVGVTFSPDGRLLASGGVYDASVHLWDPATGHEVRSLDGLPQGSSSLAFSPDGKTLAAGGYHTDQIFLWETATGKPIRELSGPAVQAAAPSEAFPSQLPDYSYVTFAPDGKTFASGHLHGLIRIWDARTLRELRHFRGPPGDAFVHLAFTSDGAVLLGWGSTIRLWQAGSWAQLRFFGEQPGLKLSCAALTPDGRMLASGSAARDVGDETLHVWETATGEERCCLTGHEYAVSAVCFSADGARMVSGSRDGTALVWDVANLPLGEPLQIGLTQNELERLWRDCRGTEGPRVYRAVLTLVHNAEQTVPFLGRRLGPVVVHSPPRVDQFIAALDSGLFKDRQEAAEELGLQVQLIEPALRRALANRPSVEARRRLEHILKANADHQPSGRQLQILRGLEILEHIGTPQARKVLESMTTGTPDFQITRDARASIQRLNKHAAAPR